MVDQSFSESGGDIQLSPDWQSITVYRAQGDDVKKWSFKRFCFSGKTYNSCASVMSGPPPEPRQILF
jgi:hypothetical protein